jgi:tRNA 2-thiouridine synthesizing protein A
VSDEIILDARGLSCPQPVVLAKKALDQAAAGSGVILVDTATARDNVARVAESNGWTVTVETSADGVIKITASK